MPQARIGDLDMRYEEAGSGPPLLLLHGLGASLEDWEFQMPEFSRHYRVVAPDLRGFGRSPRGTRPFTIAQCVQDVLGLLERLGVRECALVGYSMGGAVAQQLALERPQMVRRMVIANSVPTFRPQTLRQRLEVAYRMFVMNLLGPKRLAEISGLRMFPDQPEVRARSIARGIAYNTREGYIGALRALTRWSALERLGELKMPVLVLGAEHDYFARADFVQFAHALPRGRLRIVNNARHGLPMERPEVFNRIVLKFLRDAHA